MLWPGAPPRFAYESTVYIIYYYLHHLLHFKCLSSLLLMMLIVSSESFHLGVYGERVRAHQFVFAIASLTSLVVYRSIFEYQYNSDVWIFIFIYKLIMSIHYKWGKGCWIYWIFLNMNALLSTCADRNYAVELVCFPSSKSEVLHSSRRPVILFNRRVVNAKLIHICNMINISDKNLKIHKYLSFVIRSSEVHVGWSGRWLSWMRAWNHFSSNSWLCTMKEYHQFY